MAPRPATGGEVLSEEIGEGDRIGSFRILGELGRGGMGIVFLAEQKRPVARRVALKVLRTPFRDRAAEIRFDAERQAMARLQHPSVAQIFEAGATDSGHPWFAMEWVEGEHLTDWCDSHELGVAERLALFRDVCAAVHHAHQKGILHRDLKPSNVLVSGQTDQPVVKVIDFGIAKATDRPLVDETLETGAVLLGTPAYLAPEVLQGEATDLDIRADVYSLGVLLYELLVGARPFDSPGDSLLLVLRRATEEEPRGPSTRWTELDEDTRAHVAARRRHDTRSLPRRLRGELDWIVLRAIARDREQRYDSATALSDDLGRFLAHQPIMACPPSAAYRARKFVRRRADLVVAVALVMLSLAGGLVARSVEARRARDAAAEAEAARTDAERSLAVAVEARREAEASREEASELTAFLIELFEISDPTGAAGATVTARELLDRGAARVRDGFAERPLAEARFLQTIGDVYRKLGLYPEAESLFLRALDIREAALPPDHPDLADTANGLGALLAQTGDFEAAEPYFRRALGIREAERPPNPQRLAGSLNNLANLLADRGRFAEAEPLYRRSIEVAESLDGPPHPDLLVAWNNLASTLFDQGRLDEAEPLFRAFLAHQRTAHGGDHPHVAIAMENLAGLLAARGRLEEAETILLDAIDILGRVLGPDHPEVAYGRGELAQVLAAGGRTVEAERLFREALRVQRAVFEPEHPERRATEEGLEQLLSRNGI